MRFGQMLSPVHSLGPGERIGLWTCGCSKKCAGCMSPELQPPDAGQKISEETLAQILGKISLLNHCRGLTISGGDPFEQAKELLHLLQLVRDSFDDILVYTGYTLEEIRGGLAGTAGEQCLAYIDVLIDGRYIRKLNTPDCILRGSQNQVIYFLNEEKRQIYKEYMKKGRIIETFACNDRNVITGILNEVTDHE